MAMLPQYLAPATHLALSHSVAHLQSLQPINNRIQRHDAVGARLCLDARKGAFTGLVPDAADCGQHAICIPQLEPAGAEAGWLGGMSSIMVPMS